MLVLTRKLQQQIKIGDQITVTILRLKGHTVRIGIEAPRSVRVVRGELPPEGAEPPVESTEMTIIEGVVSIAAEPALASTEGEAGSDTLVAGSAADPSAPQAGVALSTSASLPPDRVLSRLGKAPLRQIMVNATLAK